MNFESFKNIEFEFSYAPTLQKYKTYKFNGYQIFDEKNNYVCKCDITAMNLEYNKNNLMICCHICLNSYYEGINQGKKEKQNEIKNILLGDVK